MKKSIETIFVVLESFFELEINQNRHMGLHPAEEISCLFDDI